VKTGPSLPTTARDTIAAWLDGDILPADFRAVALRLAAWDDQMREVWTRVPPDRSGFLITAALTAYAVVQDMRMPAAPKRAKFDPNLAACARRLANDLSNPTIFAERLAATGLPITLQQYVALLQETARYYDDLDAEARRFVRSLRVPRFSRKRGLALALEIQFARTLGAWFKRGFGAPMDAAVAAMTSVVFDRIDPPIDPETVKVWRRTR
jgi:hypothetical protein